MALRRRADGETDMANDSPGGASNGDPKDFHKDPRFWGLTVLIWLGLILAVENIYAKVDLLMRLAQ